MKSDKKKMAAYLDCCMTWHESYFLNLPLVRARHLAKPKVNALTMYTPLLGDRGMNDSNMNTIYLPNGTIESPQMGVLAEGKELTAVLQMLQGKPRRYNSTQGHKMCSMRNFISPLFSVQPRTQRRQNNSSWTHSVT